MKSLSLFSFLILGLALLLFSCQSSSESAADTGAEISGLLTFTDSGITFLECATGERYRVLDTDHAVMKAMGNFPLRVNEPVYMTLDGEVSEHSGEIEFERRFRKRIQPAEVLVLETEIPDVCRQHIKPIMVFEDPNVPISLVFNYYVPSAILAKPYYGRLIYFPFENEEFPDLDQSEIQLSFAAQGTAAEIVIHDKSCTELSRSAENPSTHTLFLEFEGKEFVLCLVGNIGDESEIQ